MKCPGNEEIECPFRHFKKSNKYNVDTCKTCAEIQLYKEYIISYKRQNELIKDPDAIMKKMIALAMEEDGNDTNEFPKKAQSKSYI